MSNAEKIVTGLIVMVVIIAVFSLIYVLKSLFFPKENVKENNGQQNHFSSIGFTAFDV